MYAGNREGVAFVLCLYLEPIHLRTYSLFHMERVSVGDMIQCRITSSDGYQGDHAITRIPAYVLLSRLGPDSSRRRDQ